MKCKEEIYKNIVILTEAPWNTLGDVSAARKLIDILVPLNKESEELKDIKLKNNDIIKKYYNYYENIIDLNKPWIKKKYKIKVTWYIKVSNRNIDADGLLRSDIDTILIESWDHIFLDKYVKPLQMSDLTIPFPTFHYFKPYQEDRLKKMKGKYLPIPEYNYINGNENGLEFETGFDKGLGIFIDENPVMPKSITNIKLTFDVNSFSTNIPIYFCYYNKDISHFKTIDLHKTIELFIHHAISNKYKDIHIICSCDQKEIPSLFHVANAFKESKKSIHEFSNIQITNPFPLSRNDFQNLLERSVMAAVTGDQSFSEALSREKVFLYQVMLWKSNLFIKFINFIKERLGNESKLHHFYLNHLSDDKRRYGIEKIHNLIPIEELLSFHFEELQNEIKKLKMHIIQDYNLTKNLPIKIHEIFKTHILAKDDNNILLVDSHDGLSGEKEIKEDELTELFCAKFQLVDTEGPFKYKINKSIPLSAIDISSYIFLDYNIRTNDNIKTEYVMNLLYLKLCFYKIIINDKLEFNKLMNLEEKFINRFIKEKEKLEIFYTEFEKRLKTKGSVTLDIDESATSIVKNKIFEDIINQKNTTFIASSIMSGSILNLYCILAYAHYHPECLKVFKDNDNSPFQFAVKNGKSNIVKMLLKYLTINNDMPLNPAYCNNIALVTACQNGHLKVVKALLEFSLKFPEKINEPGNGYNISLIKAIENGKIDIIKILYKFKVENPKSILNFSDGDNSPLICAVMNNQPEILQLLLEYKIRNPEWGIDPGCRNNELIIMACKQNYTKIIKVINDFKDNYISKIDFSARDYNAFVWLAKNGNYNCFSLLLSGIKKEHILNSEFFKNAFIYSLIFDKYEFFVSIFNNLKNIPDHVIFFGDIEIKAICQNKPKFIKFIQDNILDNKVFHLNDEITKILLATKLGHIETLKYLLDRFLLKLTDKVIEKNLLSVPYNYISDNGFGNFLEERCFIKINRSCINIAVENGHPEIVKHLIENFPKVNGEDEATSYDYHFYYKLAFKFNQPKVMNVLYELQNNLPKLKGQFRSEKNLKIIYDVTSLPEKPISFKAFFNHLVDSFKDTEIFTILMSKIITIFKDNDYKKYLNIMKIYFYNATEIHRSDNLALQVLIEAFGDSGEKSVVDAARKETTNHQEFKIGDRASSFENNVSFAKEQKGSLHITFTKRNRIKHFLFFDKKRKLVFDKEKNDGSDKGEGDKPIIFKKNIN